MKKQYAEISQESLVELVGGMNKLAKENWEMVAGSLILAKDAFHVIMERNIPSREEVEEIMANLR